MNLELIQLFRFTNADRELGRLKRNSCLTFVRVCELFTAHRTILFGLLAKYLSEIFVKERLIINV